MARLVVVLTVVLALVASLGDAQSVGEPTCGPRIRREWRQLSTADKELYRDAVKASMTTGYHTLFQEVLSDKATCNEVYLTSASVYWHRRFLLAYENMLRSLEPRFACLTIPYWDMFADYANQAAAVCSTMEQCSQFLGDFGGSNGTNANVAINGLNISTVIPGGNCVNGLLSRGRNATESSLNFADFSPFCQSSAANTSCSGCVPRGAWNASLLPSSLTYTALAKLIRPSYGFSYFGSTLQAGMQASMHNALNATMATCATAADPMFYSLQATFDLVHQMYYDCQIGRNLTVAEKQASTSRFAYQQYALASGVTVPTVMSNMTTYWNSTLTGQRMRAEDHPQLQQFFNPLPNQYWFYASGADLGANNSYAYAADTLINLLQLSGVTQCPQNRTRRLQDVLEAEVLGTVQPGSGDGLSSSASAASATEAPFSAAASAAGSASTPLPEESVSASTSSFSSSSGATTVADGVVLATTSAGDAEINKSVVKAFNCFQDMMAAATNITDSDLTALDSTELADCLIYDELFTVDDLSKYYLKSMGMPMSFHTVCAQRVDDYNKGLRTVVVENFEDVYDHHLNMSDKDLAELPRNSNAAAVVAITQFKTETTTDVIDVVANGDVLNSLTTTAATSDNGNRVANGRTTTTLRAST